MNVMTRLRFKITQNRINNNIILNITCMQCITCIAESFCTICNRVIDEINKRI